MPTINDTDIGNSIVGSSGDDIINANGGNDTIQPLLGNDIVRGGAGLSDLLVVDYSAAVTPVTMSAPVLTGAVSSGLNAPGNQSLSSLGNAGDNGGQTLQFTPLDGSQYNALWWGPLNPVLATDGAADEAGETLTFAGGLGTNTAVWTGSSDVSGAFTGVLLTRLTVTINSGGANWIDPTTIGLVGGPAAVTYINAATLDVTEKFEVSSDSGMTWQSVNAFTSSNGSGSAPIYSVSRDFSFDDGGYTGGISDVVGDTVSYKNIEYFSISGGSAGDILYGGRFADTLNGNGGDDVITGGGGNDFINGGAPSASDTAVFSGNLADYSITAQAGDQVTVVDNRPGSPDGTDVLTGIEHLQFADVTVNANNPPVVDLDSTSGSFDFAGSYTEGGAAANIGFGISVTDPDSGDPIERADIINTNPNPGDNFIVGPLPGGITLDGASTTSHVILTGVASAATYAAALATVRFFSGSDDPTAGGNFNRIIHTTVSDGSVASAFATTTIAVTGVNDAPDISVQPGDAAGAIGPELNGPLFASFDLTVRDPDSADTVTASVTGVALSGTTVGLGSSPAQVQAMMTVTAGSINADPADLHNLVWTWNSTPEAFDYLAIGESLTMTYTIQVADSGTPTLTDTQNVGITITGTNDAPMISASGTDSLSIGVTETNSPLTGSATLTVVDPDYSDSVVATVTGVVESGTTMGLSSSNPQLLAMLGVTGGFIPANPGAANNLTYTFNSAPQAFDYLDDGESLTLTYTVKVDDGHGGVDTQDVTVVVTGSNDAPDLHAGPGDVASASGPETDSPLATNFTLTVTDPDLSDSVTPSVVGVAASGTTLGLLSTNAQLQAMMTVTPPSIAANPGDVNNFNWAFNSTPEAFNYLAVGETLTLTYTLRATDDSSATDDQTVTLNIIGTNDAPTIGVVSSNDSNGITLTDGSAPLSTHGTLTAVDPDYSDSLSAAIVLVSITPAGPVDPATIFSMMSLSPPTVAANPGPTSPANLHWSFTTAAETFDYLAASESVTLTYIAQVTDTIGATAATAITVVINGVNEAPTIVSSLPVSPGVVEIPDGLPGENLDDHVATGTIGFADTDLTDTHSASFTPAGMGYSGVFSLGAVDQGGNSVGWSFHVNDGDLNWLTQGQTVTQTYNVTLNDGHGGTVVQPIVINLIGTNDAAHLTGESVLVVQGVTPVSTSGTLTISDEDGPNSFQAQAGVHGSYGTFGIDTDGNWTFLADTPLLSLAPGQVVTDTFTVHAFDGTPTTVAVSIAGSNDVGIARQDLFVTDEAHSIGAGLNLFNDNGSGADSDPDNPLSIGAVEGDPTKVGQQITLPTGALVTVNANGTFSYNPNHAFDYLTLASGSMDQFVYDIFNYTLAGGSTAYVLVRVNGLDTPPADQLIGSISDNNVTGTSGPDNFRLEQGGHDTATGMGGNDSFYFGAALDHSDTVDGGGGTDTVAMQGNTNVSLGNITNVEVLLALSGSNTAFGDTAGNHYSYDITSNDGNVAAGQKLSVIATGLLPGENLHFNGSAETDGNFRIFAGQGVDNLIGGGGSDGFFFGADGNLTGADHVDGGAGIDTLALRGNYVGANAVVFTNTSFANIEVLALLSGHTNEFGGVIVPTGYDYDVTIADGDVAAGQRLDVNAVRLAADESVRFDGRAETNGTFRILSGAGDDTLWGGSGDDVIYGGMGADRMIGGGGTDLYSYRSAAESTSTGYDTIVGFDWHFDRIDAPGGPRTVTQSVSGALSTASFDANLAAGLAGVLGSGQAALFTASSGTLSGHVFLVIDTNGVAGYQAGDDMVIELQNAVMPIDPTTPVVI